jgi:hypothetical protein
MTLALAQLVKDAFPSFGAKVQVVVLGMIAVHELFGPVLFRRAIIAVHRRHRRLHGRRSPLRGHRQRDGAARP